MDNTKARLPGGGVDNLMLCCDSYKVKVHEGEEVHVTL